ncbi:hypothetical protein [Paenibacillus agricola]|uniref:Major facilitator superfamily (MFS) profile domain-containing protein n=1 Tax=Paenibacillus agricola TaxID=2716264 RepID=A0ABX0J3E6_9BACL|nr:hypothetical protein [Paenibacillus agricola]NHN30351.1 hypothetical protein [Paenibacillus agricola]
MVAAFGFVQSYYQNDISEYLGVGRAFHGLTWSTNIIISALCAPIGGLLVDKYGYKKVMLFTGITGNIDILTMLYANTSVGYFIGCYLLLVWAPFFLYSFLSVLMM